MIELIPLFLFIAVCLVLMCGYPVAFSLAGTSLVFAAAGLMTGTFDGAFLSAIPNRFYGIMINTNLFAVPMFVFMGMMLEKSKILKDKPITIIQGRYDMVCPPPKTAYELHQAIPKSKLIIIPDAGHSASEAGTLSSLLDATDEFKTIIS